jgi:hypothetical protein
MYSSIALFAYFAAFLFVSWGHRGIASVDFFAGSVNLFLAVKRARAWLRGRTK